MQNDDLKNNTPTDANNVLAAVPFLDEPINADWRDAVKQLPDGCVDLVVTDPPYGMSYQSNMRKEKHKKIVGMIALIGWKVGWLNLKDYASLKPTFIFFVAGIK